VTGTDLEIVKAVSVGKRADVGKARDVLTITTAELERRWRD
jgi:hypothetical protein